MKQDVEGVVFECHQENGLQSDAKWSDLSQDEQSVLSQWMMNSPLEGRGTLVTYVPMVVIRAKRFNFNLQAILQFATMRSKAEEIETGFKKEDNGG